MCEIKETKTDAYYKALGVDTDDPDWQELSDELKERVVDDSYWEGGSDEE